MKSQQIERERMGTDFIHDGVEILLSNAVFVLSTLFPLFLQVCQEFEHLGNTDRDRKM